MMMNIRKILLPLILSSSIILTQYPSASFEFSHYSFDENLDRASVTLQIENPDLVDLGGIDISLTADTSVIRFDPESISWNVDCPFSSLMSISSNAAHSPDTLSIAATTSAEPENFQISFAKIFDISFNVVGEANDSTLIKFLNFQIQTNYTENTSDAMILLIGEDSEDPISYDCTDPSACNYSPDATIDCPECCEYEQCTDCDGNINPCGDGSSECDDFLVLDECDVCGGNSNSLDCAGTCDTTDPRSEELCESGFGWNNGGDLCLDYIALTGDNGIDECGICGGNNFYIDCVDQLLGTCTLMDCSGICGNYTNSLTPCGDCSDDSNCNFSVSMATFSDSTILDNNFRSENIEIPISLNNFDFVGFSEISSETQGFEGMAFSVNFDPRLLVVNSINSIELKENFSYNFGVDQLNDSLAIISGILTDDGNGTLYQSLDGPVVNLSFDVIEAVYNPELHGTTSEISLQLTSLNGVNIIQENIGDTGALTIYTKACIDPLASTFDSNFICDCIDGNTLCDNEYYDICDENGILGTSNIFNDGCELPEPDFTDILSSRIGDEEVIKEFDTYTLIVPDGTTITFPNEETSLDIISSSNDLVDINLLPDVAPGAKLAGSLVGLYPFGIDFDSPLEFRFTFEDVSLSRGTPEYKILYMDDIQNGDWEEVGTCSDVVLGFCKIEELGSSGLFIVMYGENLESDGFSIPNDFNLYQNYPNPFNPTTALEFDIAKSAIVNFTVYNISGQIVELISSKLYTPGNYEIKWEAGDVPSGIYLIQMQTESSKHVQKVMLLK